MGGQAYKDGQQFHLNCSRLCSCHDGRHICTDTCRHQAVTPSTAHCTQPQLVSVRGRCCREWVCPHVYNLVPAPAAEGGQSTCDSRLRRHQHQISLSPIQCSRRCHAAPPAYTYTATNQLLSRVPALTFCTTYEHSSFANLVLLSARVGHSHTSPTVAYPELV